MKKQIKIYWNHLDYPTQVRAVDLIAELIEQQKDPLMKTAIMAAIEELKMWSNSPCEIVSSPEGETMLDPNQKTNKGWIH